MAWKEVAVTVAAFTVRRLREVRTITSKLSKASWLAPVFSREIPVSGKIVRQGLGASCRSGSVTSVTAVFKSCLTSCRKVIVMFLPLAVRKPTLVSLYRSPSLPFRERTFV